jgi:hypothetical protein
MIARLFWSLLSALQLGFLAGQGVLAYLGVFFGPSFLIIGIQIVPLLVFRRRRDGAYLT